MQVQRQPTLPVLPTPVCPAATIIHGESSFDGAIICGVIAKDLEKDDGVGMSAGQLAIARHATGGVVLSQKSDPASVERLCCGTDLPVVYNSGAHRSADGGTRQHYTHCPAWIMEKKRIEDARNQLKGGGLLDEEEPGDPEALAGRFHEDEPEFAGYTYDTER